MNLWYLYSPSLPPSSSLPSSLSSPSLPSSLPLPPSLLLPLPPSLPLPLPPSLFLAVCEQVKEKEAELKSAEQRLHDEFEKLRTKNQEEKRLQDDKKRQLVSVTGIYTYRVGGDGQG